MKAKPQNHEKTSIMVGKSHKLFPFLYDITKTVHKYNKDVTFSDSSEYIIINNAIVAVACHEYAMDILHDVELAENIANIYEQLI